MKELLRKMRMLGAMLTPVVACEHVSSDLLCATCDFKPVRPIEDVFL